MKRNLLCAVLLLAGCFDARGSGQAESESKSTSGPGCIAASADEGDDACASEQRAEPGATAVLGGPLAPCAPPTGFYRDGTCRTGAADRGNHTVCAVMTDAFLDATKKAGNDLITPRPELRFPGLTAGDRWCLCASRWEEARRQGVAPGVVIESTEANALRGTSKAALLEHAVSE